MRRIELPGGAWADLREISEITERLRRPIKVIAGASAATIARLQGVTTTDDMAALGLSEDEADRFSRLQDATIVAVVAAWSYDLPISTDSLLDIPAEAYDALAVATATVGAKVAVDVSPTPAPEPGNPTGD